MTGFNEFMSQTSTVNRWFALKVGLSGVFCGAVLMFGFMMLGFS